MEEILTNQDSQVDLNSLNQSDNLKDYKNRPFLTNDEAFSR